MTRKELRDHYAGLALSALASKTFTKEFQKIAQDQKLQESELLANYCWQIADDMLTYREL